MITNVASTLKPLVVKEFQTFLGKQNFVSTHITETPVVVIAGTLPVNLMNIAMDIRNQSTGLAISSSLISLPIPDGIQFTTKLNDIKIAIPGEYFDQLSVFAHDAGSNVKQTTSFLGQMLANRAGLIRENELATVVQGMNYGASNTIDLTAVPVKNWTDKEFGELAAAFATATTILNRAHGYNLIDSEQKISSEYVLHNVIPQPLWNALVGRWSSMKDFVTVQGLGAGDYRRLETGIFDYITYGAKTSVAMAEKVADNQVTDGKFNPGQMVPLWTQEDANSVSIYLFTSSANELNPASIKDVVFKKDTILQNTFLGDEYYKASVRRAVVSCNDYAFFKIDLKLA